MANNNVFNFTCCPKRALEYETHQVYNIIIIVLWLKNYIYDKLILALQFYLSCCFLVFFRHFGHADLFLFVEISAAGNGLTIDISSYHGTIMCGQRFELIHVWGFCFWSPKITESGVICGGLWNWPWMYAFIWPQRVSDGKTLTYNIAKFVRWSWNTSSLYLTQYTILT